MGKVKPLFPVVVRLTSRELKLLRESEAGVVQVKRSNDAIRMVALGVVSWREDHTNYEDVGILDITDVGRAYLAKAVG